ncbi:MAG: hypothetical protein JNL98_05865 [Bryobacterales bacterium]|nr:hypothetical protein [Bryobacterales bacterium]
MKAALLDPRTFRVVESRRIPFPPFEPGLPPLHREVNVALIVDRVRELLDALWPDSGECRALMVSGQMHGFVSTDSNGVATSNYVSWLDQRSAADFEVTRGRIGDAAYQALGNELRPGIALATLASMRRAGTFSGVSVCSLASYVVSQLCQTPAVEEPTYAASLGALDLLGMRWHRDALAVLDLDAIVWPELRSIAEPAGKWRGVPVYPAVGDQQCSLAGALLAEGELSINVSTGSQIASIARELQAGRSQNRPYFDGLFLRTVTHLPAGRALDSLMRLLTEMGCDRDPWQYVLEAAAAVPSTDVQANLCFFPGPLGSSGGFQGLTEQNLTAGHLFRAAFEAMASNYHQAAAWLGQKHFAGIVFSGGLVQKSAVLRDCIVRKFAIPWRSSPTEEDCMLGLLLLGTVATGEYRTLYDATASARATICRTMYE